MSLDKRFGDIYRHAEWGEGSGSGSTPVAARPYVEAVLRIAASTSARRVVDVGHGDWRMWPEDAFDGLEYFGLDVADGLSEQLMVERGRADRTFAAGDARSATLPAGDLALCKDVLQHLSNADAAIVLERLRAYPTVIICHDVFIPHFTVPLMRNPVRMVLAALRTVRTSMKRVLRPNPDIESGGYRELDILRAPVNARRLGFKVIESFDFPGKDGPRRRSVRKRVWVLRSVGD